MLMQTSWTGLGTSIASLMFLWTMVRKFLPRQFDLCISTYTHKIFSYFYPYIEITFQEYSGDRFSRNEAYTTIKSYLSAATSERARKLKAEVGKGSSNLVVTMDDHEQVTDEFKGVKLWWSSNKKTPPTQTISIYPAQEEHRYFILTFHHRDRRLVMDCYLAHVMEEGKAMALRNRQRKLYTNNRSQSSWSHVVFEHPATFEKLAMDPEKKEDIIDDLEAFKNGKDYYEKIGKAWKRGYLLYGPPGTGKSTMISAMANFLDYDVYDLELTAVKDNTELKKLFIETTNRSIIVVEDIDCSLDVSGKRMKEEKPKEEEEEEEKKKHLPGVKKKEEDSKVTLSGLLNFIDGLWSACGGERLIIFTTNHVEKLDPALIRRGRMDKHIELSYCSFEGFKVFAKNYLDLESHPLFERIRLMMKITKITPADVAEKLMPKSFKGKRNVESCLEDLIQFLQEAKAKEEEAIQLELKSKEELKSRENGSVEITPIENGCANGEVK
ncbi:AAA-ATPase ASD, mitochondrial-like protein [Cinnamomum micranthum f. kanehirae]|uniref:AAA-ATPase ASD, mitochondrial-like protein n=1 Tax=Cinnamomum micranthum f. kanehirae TaxID=337451 RepID=A0A3S3N4I2_9MAGN|nr:AAA-ATPase ASD, mitochondrial-like protein [Cinnamomum micranthum f. kanehirae]